MVINTQNKIVKVEELNLNDRNPKVDFRTDPVAKTEYEKLLKSIRINGQIEPVLVRIDPNDKKYYIVNGNHRFQAMKELGFTEVEIKVLGEISQVEALKYIISTEDIKIPLDEMEVIRQIKELQETNSVLLEDLPYSATQIQNKLELLSFNIENYNKTLVEVEVNVEESEKHEKIGKHYITIQKENLDYLVEHFKRHVGKFALNGDELVGKLRGGL